MIEDNMCIRAIPVYDNGEVFAMRKECVITKEEFIECYNAWIKEKKNEDSQL